MLGRSAAGQVPATALLQSRCSLSLGFHECQAQISNKFNDFGGIEGGKDHDPGAMLARFFSFSIFSLSCVGRHGMRIDRLFSERSLQVLAVRPQDPGQVLCIPGAPQQPNTSQEEHFNSLSV